MSSQRQAMLWGFAYFAIYLCGFAIGKVLWR